MNYVLSYQAYLKIFFHAAKHPHQPVNGVLIGKSEGKKVFIEDSIPLLHHWTSLSPMMEIGLDLAGQHAQASNLQLVGYYQASERLDDTALAPVGEKVAYRLKQGFKDAIAFVIDGETIGSGSPALIPYLASSSNPSEWRSSTSTPAPFTPGSAFSLAQEDSPQRALELVRDSRVHQKFGDFDDHLEDVTIDWIGNKECMKAAELWVDGHVRKLRD